MGRRAADIDPETGKVERKKGKLYFVSKGGTVIEADMNRKGGKKGIRHRTIRKR